jgi:hypothetical protein
VKRSQIRAASEKKPDPSRKLEKVKGKTKEVPHKKYKTHTSAPFINHVGGK